MHREGAEGPVPWPVRVPVHRQYKDVDDCIRHVHQRASLQNSGESRRPTGGRWTTPHLSALLKHELFVPPSERGLVRVKQLGHFAEQLLVHYVNLGLRRVLHLLDDDGLPDEHCD